MSTTRRPNAIETKHEMNCSTCSLLGRCKFAKDIHYTDDHTGSAGFMQTRNEAHTSLNGMKGW